MAVIFTSGTTGVSKGVRCSYMHHYTYGANLFPPALGADDRYYLCLPLYHAAATNATYTFLRRGGSIAVVESFVTDRFWADVRRFGATCSNIATSMSTFLQDAPARHDDADNPMRMAYMGPMLDDTAGFCKRFDMQVFSCYGSTEVPGPIFSGPVTTNNGSVGKLAGPGFQARIVDEHDIEVPPGVVGELVVRHDLPWAMFSGYLGMPEQDAAVWRNGWFHTGDAMRVDAEGNYYFSDRIRDTIRRRAENISSVEVEAEILSHPAVGEVAVVAVPSEHEEDEVMAYVVPVPGRTPELTELVDHSVDRLPYFMVPRYWELVDELPKTPTFKVQKAQLRKLGVTSRTWDREAAGYRLRRERFTTGRP
jgi:crotonobetaine/carnitine-CoA ligase